MRKLFSILILLPLLLTCEMPLPVEDVVDLESCEITYINSVWLVTVAVTVSNISLERLKYIYLEAKVYNAVDDLIWEDIRRYSTTKIKMIGPFEPGETYTQYWTLGYFSSADHVEAELTDYELMD